VPRLSVLATEHLGDLVTSQTTVAKRRREHDDWWERFPWWGVLVAAVIGAMGLKIALDADYDLAWKNIYPGVWTTIKATFYAFGIAFVLGLVSGIGQVSRNVVARNVARAYVELVRGIPILPLIFTLALVVIPDVSAKLGFANSVPNFWRAIIALALIYGAYMAEIFRGGIQSISPGQREAGRSLGLTYPQTMRYVVLPQAARAIIPPMGNDFIAILKDTSLLSVLGVLELTRNTRQYSAQTFRFREGYFTLTFIYLVLVVALSLSLTQLEKYMSRDREGER